MADRRSHSPADPAAALAQRVKALVAQEGAPRRRRRGKRIEPVRRSSIAAAWQAREAVRSGMTLDDFLRARLARYVAALPVPTAALPLQVAVEDGQIAARPVDAPRAAPAADGPDGWIAPLVAAEGPAVREEALALEVRLATVDGELEAARRRTEEISRRFSGDVAAGLVAAPDGVDATAEQLGRPAVPGAAARSAVAGIAVAAAIAQTWQIAVPLLAGAGVDAGAIEEELARRPGEVVSVLLFALGVAAALFALARAGLAAADALARGEGEPPRRRWLAATAAGAGALSAVVAGAVAALPRSVEAHGAASGAALALLLVAVPVGVALLLSAARRREEARAAQEAAALAWDRERALTLAERGRRLEELEWAREELRGLERQRDAARRRLRELNARAIAVGRLASEEVERERAALGRVAQGLAASLELDRYEFVRQATARGAAELLQPRRRRAPEARPPAYEPAPAPPAVAAVTAVGGVEPGRLAS